MASNISHWKSEAVWHRNGKAHFSWSPLSMPTGCVAVVLTEQLPVSSFYFPRYKKYSRVAYVTTMRPCSVPKNRQYWHRISRDPRYYTSVHGKTLFVQVVWCLWITIDLMHWGNAFCFSFFCTLSSSQASLYIFEFSANGPLHYSHITVIYLRREPMLKRACQYRTRPELHAFNTTFL